MLWIPLHKQQADRPVHVHLVLSLGVPCTLYSLGECLLEKRGRSRLRGLIKPTCPVGESHTERRIGCLLLAPMEGLGG